MSVTGKMYVALIGIFLIIFLVVYIYISIRNYFYYGKAKKRKVIFKKENGKLKGYWRTKKGDEYDKTLKIED